MTTVLDGGLATELEARGHDLSDRLWSARLLMTDPAAIEAVHLAYFRAGAQLATTASYQASIEGFAAAGLDRAAALGLIRDSVAIARRAADRAAAEAAVATVAPVAPDGPGRRLAVAGSIGPYGAMLADGSEYRGDYDPGPDALRDFHAPRMDALLEAGADLLAMETIPTLREGEVLVALLAERGASGWLSYQCRDDAHTAAGEPIEAAVAVADGRPGLVGIGVNCTAPRHVPALLAKIAAVTSMPLVAYPNGGDRWNATARRWVVDDAIDGHGQFSPEVVVGWSELGAGWLGGCCGTGPAEISRIAAALAGA